MNHITLILNETLEDIRSPFAHLEFTHRGLLYRRLTNSDFNGFYDWLRAPTGEIIGFRYSLFESYSSLERIVRDFTYATVEESLDRDTVMSFFFCDRRDHAEDMSADQLFVDDYIYRANGTHYAISVPEPTELLNRELFLPKLV